MRRIECNYRPHVSLVYSDLSQEEMTSRLDAIKDEIRKAKEIAGKKFPCMRPSLYIETAARVVVECSLILKSDLMSRSTVSKELLTSY